MKPFLAMLLLLLAAWSPAYAQAPPAAGESRPPYPWLSGKSSEALDGRFPAPEGFERLPQPAGSFSAWLRGLPLKPGKPPVLLHNGRRKYNQSAHAAVIDIDVGQRDLQQCADAVMRLRAEYLRSAGHDSAISFKFTSGHPAVWSNWRDGQRPSINGNKVTWSKKAAPDGGYNNFRKYLDTVFTYAGSASLSAELLPVKDPRLVDAGDVFIRGGHPGHAVIVVDAAADDSGDRRFLLAQSFMPAQEIHVLNNPNNPKSAWYTAAQSGVLETPEWTFRYEDLKRFPVAD